MALNMADPAAVMAVYSSILGGENNWLLLHYVNDSYDELGLDSYGAEGLEELKTKISDMNKVFIAFYREEVDKNPGFVIINFVPMSVSGVRRARALVHSRRVGAILKNHQAIFTVDSLSLITSESVRDAINNPDRPLSPPAVSTSVSQFSTTSGNRSQSPTAASPSSRRSLPRLPQETFEPEKYQEASAIPPPMRPASSQQSQPPLSPMRPTKPSTPPVGTIPRRSFTATYAPTHTPSPPPPVPSMPKGSNLLSKFLPSRRKNKSEGASGIQSFGDMSDDGPPPTPPKDKNGSTGGAPVIGYSRSQPPPPHNHYEDRTLKNKRSHSMSDFAVISYPREEEKEEDELVVVEPREYAAAHKPYQNEEANKSLYVLPLKGKWAHEGILPTDPAERARRRRELQLQREQEEREALDEEERRQHERKKEKEEVLRREREDEKRRKRELEEEIQRMTAERRRKEQLEKEEEERKTREMEERKRLDRERRAAEHRRLEKWRVEQAEKVEAAARKAEVARREEEAERRQKIQLAEAKVKQVKGSSDLTTGWVTVLGQDSLSWKRRFYRFVGNTVFLYRDSKDLTSAVEEVNLRGNLRGLKEWNEGYEDLEAIAFSFVAEFRDERRYWSLYADSEGEKYKILGLFKVAGGI